MATLSEQLTEPPRFTHWRQRQTGDALAHIPGEAGLPIVGQTFKMLAHPHGYVQGMVAKYGRVYKARAFGGWQVALIGADANELVLFDREKIFSSTQGWGPILDRLFPRGLMLLDFDHHRMDRRALSIAFKPEPMRHYMGALNRGIARQVSAWGASSASTRMVFYPAIKSLSLDLAADSFLGLPLGSEADRINRAFVDMVQASVAPIRRALPFTQMKRGINGRAYLVDFFTREVARRRAGEGIGQDMFSQFATATDDAGALLPVDEVVDHMNFLMMAAHDTITSSATSLVYYLARHPEWQARLRDEALAATGGRDLAYEDLGKLELTEMAFKEALRLMPPVPSVPRRALRDFSFDGHHIPAGTNVGIAIHWTHHAEEYWPEPERFDPLRFTREAERTRHKYAWVPFGGGAHMCLGLHFAYMQVKVLMAQLLSRYRIALAEEGQEVRWQPWPIPKPRDGLPVVLTRI
jgi:cytochrome P450